MKPRAIWSEGTFSVLKREHKLAQATKRGIERVAEECLLSALALNLKRMVKAVIKPLLPLDDMETGAFMAFLLER